MKELPSAGGVGGDGSGVGGDATGAGGATDGGEDGAIFSTGAGFSPLGLGFDAEGEVGSSRGVDGEVDGVDEGGEVSGVGVDEVGAGGGNGVEETAAGGDDGVEAGSGDGVSGNLSGARSGRGEVSLLGLESAASLLGLESDWGEFLVDCCEKYGGSANSDDRPLPLADWFIAAEEEAETGSEGTEGGATDAGDTAADLVGESGDFIDFVGESTGLVVVSKDPAGTTAADAGCSCFPIDDGDDSSEGGEFFVRSANVGFCFDAPD